MKKKKIITVVTLFLASVFVVVGLFLMSTDLKKDRNSFLRIFPSHPALERDTLNIRYNSYYIAGGTSHHLYLANYSAPLHLLVLNKSLQDTQHVHLNVENIMNEKFWSPRVKVDSPDFYLTDGSVPVIYKGKVNNWSAVKYSHDSTYFLDFVPFNSGSFAIKSLSNPENENILGKITGNPPRSQFTKEVLQKQIDGVFCTNGTMHFNNYSNSLIYVYYYRNQFIVMDTNMHIRFKGNTIDTTRKANIKVATVSSTNTHTMAAPPLMVNKRSSASGNLLFVNSNLLAKNEAEDAFEHGTVIDVYNLINGNYKFSFYI
jgi:hypothetical protein